MFLDQMLEMIDQRRARLLQSSTAAALGANGPGMMRIQGANPLFGNGKAIIYTLPPKTVDDDVATTLGHEVMHIAMGKYHD